MVSENSKLPFFIVSKNYLFFENIPTISDNQTIPKHFMAEKITRNNHCTDHHSNSAVRDNRSLPTQGRRSLI